MEEKPQRDYKKESTRQKEINKRFSVKVPIYKAKALEEKLKKERENLYKYST